MGKLNKWRYNDANDILTLIFYIKTSKTLSCLCCFMPIIYLTALLLDTLATMFQISLLGHITNNQLELDIIDRGPGYVQVDHMSYTGVTFRPYFT